ncbi:MAG: hypothetical protein J1F16_01885 [Muribaculaceae bacterium]|nr:hypothetical protein [Muribaculaceae bacterium]
MKKRIHNFFHDIKMLPFTVALVCGFLLISTSCSHNDKEEEIDIRGKVTLKIDLNSLYTSSRASESSSPGNDAENYIDTDNLVLLILDSNDDILTALEGNSYKLRESYISPFSKYSLYYELEDEDILQRIKNKENLGLMVLANWKNYDNNCKFPDFSNFINQNAWDLLSSYTFLTQLGEENFSWMPDIQEKRLIPMFGYVKRIEYVVQQIWANVNLQRVLAKIEINDYLYNVTDPSGNTTLQIESVKLTGYQYNGRLVPDKNNYDHATSVSKTSLIAIKPNLNFVKIPMPAQGNIPAYNKWVAYVPEMVLGSNLNDPERPYFDISYSDKNGNAPISGRFRVDFATYNSNSKPTVDSDIHPNLWTSFLRNHFYRFDIMAITKISSWIDNEFDGHFLRFGAGYWFLYNEDEDSYYYYDFENEGNLLPVTLTYKDNKEWWYITRMEEGGQTYIFFEEEWARINVVNDTWTVNFSLNNDETEEHELYFRDNETNDRILCFDIEEVRYLSPDNKKVTINWTYVYDHGYWVKTYMSTDEEE